MKIAVENLKAEALAGILAGFGNKSDSLLPQLTQEAVAEALTSITDWTSRDLHQPTPLKRFQLPALCYWLGTPPKLAGKDSTPQLQESGTAKQKISTPSASPRIWDWIANLPQSSFQ